MARTNGDIIVDGIFDTAERRGTLLDAYKGDGEKVCVWLDTPLDIIESRFFKWARKNLPHPFMPPTLEEGWDKIVIIHDNDPKRVEVITNETQQQDL